MLPAIAQTIRPAFRHNDHRSKELWSSVQEVCDLLHISRPQDLDEDNCRFQHVRFKAGQTVHLNNDPLENLFLVNCGFLKSSMTDDLDKELVLSFPMKGDLIGVDSIHRQHHQSQTMTLSDCDIILLPYSSLQELCQKSEQFGHAILQIMSREIVRERYMLGVQRSLSAEAKVGRFLCMMGERYAQLGYSSRRFNLRMSRNEIANYLGVAIETVSRILSEFHRLGVITVNQREIVIIDPVFLSDLLKFSSTKERAGDKNVQKGQPRTTSKFVGTAHQQPVMALA
ncbi:Crp/Fnr family transcriptional regulator [Undibacterium sp. Ji22W]|uniref:Crp/Fnr family transcriptional regulator n=1 Tax=Undibacterium sp. Ji22W TaxID=3413038 RepID=UPI003BEFCD09